jgi:hypothetical protein
MSDTPLQPSQTHGETNYPSTPPKAWAIPTVDEALANPGELEDRLHAALSVRALKWLEYLEAEEQDPARVANGQRAITLDLQVDMFKVIAEWLKTSKKTKNPDKDIDGTPAGIDAMSQAIERAMMAMGARSAPLESKNDEDDEVEVHQPGIQPVPVATPKKQPSGAQKRRAAREQSEDDELALLLNRARDRALRGEDDGVDEWKGGEPYGR